MATNALQEIKRSLNAIEIKGRFNEILGAKAPQFMASITNAVANSTYLQNCEPQSIMSAAFIAASLDLPIDPNLGRAWIIPYGSKAQFQIGYKGFVELAIRTGKYRDMNAVEVYADEILEYNPILGKLRFVDDFSKCTQREKGETDKIVGYYAYYELLTGFSKGLYMTKAQVINHANRYSMAYKKKKQDSPWFTNFDDMAKKTVLKMLLSKWAMLSIEMQKAITEDQKVFDMYGNGEYADNMIETTATDELAEQVVEEIVEQVKDEPAPEKKTRSKKKNDEGMNPPEQPEQVDFMQFDAQFNDEMPFV